MSLFSLVLFLVENPCCLISVCCLCTRAVAEAQEETQRSVCVCVCVMSDMRWKVRCTVYRACIFIWLLEIYVDTDKTVSCVVSSCHPQSVFSVEPLHGAHRSWGRGRAWLTGQSKHRYAAWGEETCHRFPNEERKAMWVGKRPMCYNFYGFRYNHYFCLWSHLVVVKGDCRLTWVLKAAACSGKPAAVK